MTENKAPFYSIIDANINRISEGLRVIEEYVRFVRKDSDLSANLAALRKKVNLSEESPQNNLHIRNIHHDARAMDPPPKRTDILDTLKANFKRVEEALRVLEEYTGNTLYNKLRYEVYMLEKKILLPLYKKELPKGIYLISDNVDTLKRGLDTGAAIIQLRDKKGDKKSILDKAIALKKVCENYTAPLIINDYLDIAMYIDADGLHTGQDDIDIAVQRDLFGLHKIIGRSTHSLAQGKAAQTAGADYVSVGPIWETPSKPGRSNIGFDYLKTAKENLSIPFVAIGGIDQNTLSEILPYNPPLIGIIRAIDHLPQLQKMIDTHNKQAA